MTTLQLSTGETLLGLPVRGFGTSLLLIGALCAPILLMHTATAQQADGLELPEDIAARSALGDSPEEVGSESADSDAITFDDNRKYFIEERRVGGRLERVTVRRKNGLDEVYENPEVDSMWISEDKELGELQNVRRWTIGSW